VKKQLLQGLAGFAVGIVAFLCARLLYVRLGVNLIVGFVLVLLALLTLLIAVVALWLRWISKK